jgi:hypothetical protein
LPANRAIALAGLEDKAGSRVGLLSGGQRQGLYFAFAVCGADLEVAGADLEEAFLALTDGRDARR